MDELDQQDPSAQSHYDVIVVGGGAAGIMAAIRSAQKGARTALLEKNERLGKKILISGGGKCNITNTNITLDRYHGSHPRFVQDVLRAFDQHALLDWMNHEVGVETYEGEKYGKIWPTTNMSKTVTAALERALRVAAVDVYTKTHITGASVSGEATTRIFSLTCADGRAFTCRALVMASGGRAAPHLGADGSGLAVAEGFGHKLVEQHPALVGLTTSDAWGHELSGLTCDEVELRLLVKGKEVVSVHDSLLFTHWGITSPGIFRLSREATPALEAGDPVQVTVNWRSDAFRGIEDAQKMLHHALGSNTKKHAGTVLGYVVGYRRLGDALVRLAGGDPEQRVRELQKSHRDKLEELIYRCPFDITGSLGWERAEVMRGGVDVRKIDPRSMASKLQEGLFICGEMLDIDADVGGFNFQFAFASGRAAGEAAAASVK